MLETFESLRLIRAFGRESHEENRFNVASRAVSKVFFKLDRITSLVYPKPNRIDDRTSDQHH